MKNARRKSLYALVATALLGVLVMPLAGAGAAKGPSKNAAVTAQIKKLNNRIAALENRQTPVQATAAPIGPAGGDLRGTYPNPTIGPDAVTGAEITDNTINDDDVVDQGLGFGSLALDSVGGSELKTTHAVVGAGVDVAANTTQNANVTCPAGEVVIGGGYAWLNDATGLSMTANAPSEGNPNGTWEVRGRSNVNNRLFAWANCLVG